MTRLRLLCAAYAACLRVSARTRHHSFALLCAALLSTVATRAAAHKNGEAAQGCNGCHGGGKEATVLITSNSATVSPGQKINLTVSISQTNGPTAGFFMQSNNVGTFSIVDTGTKLLAGGVTHTAPRTGSGGVTTFNVGWTAPAQPGGVDFYVWANSTNGDGKSSGDGEGDGFFSTAFGCAGTKYYHDYDGDGVGADSSGYTINCSLPQYYSTQTGDCNDNDPRLYPGAMEVCDGKDNNCDGQIDEGLAIGTYCTDKDGDGHGVTGGPTKMGCGPGKGFGLCDNDCNDNDPTIYPGAPELCNSRDDNCNNRIDENARAVCGVGWCARYADGCSTTTCTPGQPRAEQCNAFDDDCDGVVDNGTDLELCGKPGLVCRLGECVGDGDAGAATAPGKLQPLPAGIGNTSGGTTPGSTPGSAPESTSGPTTVGYCGFGRSRVGRPFAFAGLLLGLGLGLGLGLARRRGRRRGTRG